MRPIRGWASVAALLAMAACGGDDHGGVTVLSGELREAPAGVCGGCATSDVSLEVFALQGDALPAAVPLSRPIVTDASGRFEFEDLSSELAGARNVIVVGTIGGQAFCAGAAELAEGRTNVARLDVASQVACQAAADITAGTALTTGNQPDGCEVASNGDCVSGQTCSFTLDPSFMDRAHIGNLEKAARLVEDRVRGGETSVTRAACAAINCTFEGAGEASLECLDGFL